METEPTSDTHSLSPHRPTRQQVDYCEALQTSSRGLGIAPPDLASILRRLLHDIELIVHSAPMLVFLRDTAKGCYAPCLTRNFAPPDTGLSYAPGDVVIQRMATADRPIYLPDASAPTTGTWTREEELGLVLFLPLRSKAEADELAGWVALGPRRPGEPYTPDDLRFLSSLVDQATIAIENARLGKAVRDADRAKSEFIDFVAHEMKQPMTSIQGYAKMLTMGIGGPLNDTQAQFVEVINNNIDRMGKLVNDLLEISRLEAGRIHLKLIPVQLAEVVDETIANTHNEIEARHHKLKIETLDDLPPVWGDRERLVQILTNLVSNAYRYTPEGGTIQIAVNPARNGEDTSDSPRGHLCIQVSDTGIGMSPQDVVKLEEKFFRADDDLVQEQPGTGLGISITRNLVALHGGEFFVESELGVGSTFGFTVPVASAQHVEGGAASNPGS